MTGFAPSPPTRRCFLRRSAGFAAISGIAATWPAASGRAAPEAMREAVRAIVGEAEPREGRIALDIPLLVENGNAVPLTVSVDSPMIPADHVTAIHVLSEKNPRPQVISVALGPRAGQARLSTRIKLADSQKIVALAEMSDGSFWTASTDVVVTLAACIEELQ
jgi:sulfur-oxidizing protein SoxY